MEEDYNENVLKRKKKRKSEKFGHKSTPHTCAQVLEVERMMVMASDQESGGEKERTSTDVQQHFLLYYVYMLRVRFIVPMISYFWTKSVSFRFSGASTEKQAEFVLRWQTHNRTHTLALAQVVANQAQKEYQTELRTFRNWDAAWLLMTMNL